MSGERAAYWIVRMLVAAAGLWIIVVAAVVPIMLPAPVALQLAGIAPGLPLGALMLCPNRLTVAGRRYRYRLAVSILVGLYFIAAGLAAIPAGFDGDHDPR